VSMGVHERLDLDRWLHEFPLETMIEEKHALAREHNYQVADDWLPGGSTICSPIHLAKVEHTRRALIARGHELGPANPVDIFLWRVCKISKGPITRIGGQPFRDPSKPWPTAKRAGPLRFLKDVRPLPFLAQISFLDSKDLVPGDLPGDVLGIYGDWHYEHSICADSLAFEWVQESNGEDAALPHYPDVPMWSFCAEGVIHRSVSYPHCYELLLDLNISSPYTTNRYQATSIGADAHFIQGEPDGLSSLVATFTSFQASKKWPFTNCPEVPHFTYPKGHMGDLADMFEMLLGDMGSMFFFKDDRGRYRSGWDCY
jgi:hypothetical protein